MGLLSSGDWEAHWIQGGQFLRREFTLEREVERARAYVCGLGYYELRMNGRKVGDRVLDPGWTLYQKRALYSTYDVTDYLANGRNALGIILGNGRHIEAYGYGLPKAIMQLEMEFTDGSRETIATDESWSASDGPIVSDDLFNGEEYDARLEKPGWDSPDFDDSSWSQCTQTDPPGGRLVSQASFPPIRKVKALQPVDVLNPRPGVYVYDFGQNFTGWVRLRVRGPRGTEVRLRFSELLDRDGMINTKPNRQAKSTDVYILKGEGVEEYEPRFTYHGFRYVELTGFPGTPTIRTLEGIVVYSDVEEAGGFICSDPLINRIHGNIIWGQLSNLMSVPTDCPQRDERMGWTGDAQLTAEESILNFWMPGFFEKWIDDILDAQEEDGRIQDVVPPYWRFPDSDPAWGTTITVIPWLLYVYYGDVRILEKCYQGVIKWVEYLLSNSTGFVLSMSKYGDWCPPAHVKPVETPGELVSTWVFYHDALTISKMAKALGRQGDSEKYEALATKIREVFNERFLKDDSYSTGSQTCHILPLYLDIVPEDRAGSVFENLVKDIEVTHDRHLNTGIIGTRYLLDTLTKYGRSDLAYDIATQTTYPSWGYMIREGATTLWERWEYLAGGGMNSHNHIMFGAVDAWFYRTLAGINVDPSAPAFERFIIEPHIVGDLRFVSASTRTIVGTVRSEWVRSEGRLMLKLSVPVGSSTEIYVPKMGLENISVRESGEEIWRDSEITKKADGIIKAGEEDGSVVFEVGSGQYAFELTGER
jgi:alpha-L-rhamnosidase